MQLNISDRMLMFNIMIANLSMLVRVSVFYPRNEISYKHTKSAFSKLKTKTGFNYGLGLELTVSKKFNPYSFAKAWPRAVETTYKDQVARKLKGDHSQDP